MSRVALRQILGQRSAVGALVSAYAEALGAAVTIDDASGRRLHGDPATPPANGRFPVMYDEASLGSVAGPDGARAVAALLEHLASREGERKALGAEVLHLYREINLIYAFSEKLAALLEVEGVARLTLRETRHLIVATDGVIMLLDEEEGALAPVARFGEELASLTGVRRGDGIVGTVAASGVGEIVNDVDHDARRITAVTSLKALICAPMKVGERVVGVIALGSTVPMAYTAAQLKLLNTLALQTATAIENARLFERTIQAARERERLLALQQETELARAKLESEMKLAARIQADLFPATLPRPDGYDMAARNHPARRCGGDYYDALPLAVPGAAQHLLLCVADVSGKGLPAALLMSNMQATLRALLGRGVPLPRLAEAASDLLYAATSPEKYVTAALVDLTPGTGELRFVGAGHLDNAILRADGAIVPLTSTGAPLGLLPPGLPFGEMRDVLHPGDAIVLYSDGVTDAQDASGAEFGESRLYDLLRRAADLAPETIIDRVFRAVETFVGGTPQFDDMTMLVLRRR
ncbi:MAG TPA: GAF domain-containing SpoIIE family protein phosphatase [Vicinamibacterales bacterium]|nr:GAF domain-containing SpoIIE family protein phosphatase [Vicinamibacterales bacterium]